MECTRNRKEAGYLYRLSEDDRRTLASEERTIQRLKAELKENEDRQEERITHKLAEKAKEMHEGRYKTMVHYSAEDDRVRLQDVETPLLRNRVGNP